ncbi:deoxyribodipyrimidine photo-lyase [Pasteurellaceae bacterium HPA106]|uniref:cryptochrome/photolyase family protein n=1 Tax=Spirabiliibacterium pneumoniae TaxID=221400 RepID=UPI001AAD7270|nr:deoxyribodipyrimidine photo-lyase [Spirabiliibacterium pneumoniae]MBE2896015.1 deoxyribodipyrimidine photo-lyase [Spirabiliibacterium pneumoniae]
MTTIVWLRRDLRLFDNRTLQTALLHNKPVVAVFVFDTTILATLKRDDRRLTFIHQSLVALREALAAHHIPLWVVHDDPKSAVPSLAKAAGATRVVCAEDYEPAAIARDSAVRAALACDNVAFEQVCDQVIFPKGAILTQQGKPYSVFTPYKKAWLAKLLSVFEQLALVDDWGSCVNDAAFFNAHKNRFPLPELRDLGFERQDNVLQGGEEAARERLQDFLPRLARYHQLRDFPAKKGVSYLSTYLRFGLLSIRHLVRLCLERPSEGADTWLSELIWREFYQQLLYHYPNVVHESFKEHYRAIKWGNNPDWFAAWKCGQTGFPIVDAAMRQLNQTGFMHNRLRMIVASFLTKDLLIDWRWGEAYFAEKLLDFDLAANNGGWQWAASTGCDAQPYFRIFNPVTQSQKFDPDGEFIRRYVPELSALNNKDIHAPWVAKTPVLVDYPAPMVDHTEQRKLALAMFKAD